MKFNFRNVSVKVSINPPIRGSIAFGGKDMIIGILYQSPYKGFNRMMHVDTIMTTAVCINPPIRGSIGLRKQTEFKKRKVSIPL